MVKNNFGGNKTKGVARKNLIKRDTALRVADEDGEIYAQAVKVMGGNIASAIDVNGNPLRVHIRGKFRGRGKRDNFIGPGTWLLVGLHAWESNKPTSKSDVIINCDILEVYCETDKYRLKNSVTSVNWSLFITNDTKTFGEANVGEVAGGIDFVDDNTDEYQELIAAQASAGTSNTLITGDEELVDVDDI